MTKGNILFTLMKHHSILCVAFPEDKASRPGVHMLEEILNLMQLNSITTVSGKGKPQQ